MRRLFFARRAYSTHFTSRVEKKKISLPDIQLLKKYVIVTRPVISLRCAAAHRDVYNLSINRPVNEGLKSTSRGGGRILDIW